MKIKFQQAVRAQTQQTQKNMNSPDSFVQFLPHKILAQAVHDAEEELLKGNPEFACAVEVDGTLYVMGGHDGTNKLSSIEKLEIQQSNNNDKFLQLTAQLQMTQQCSTSMAQSIGSQADQLPPPSQIPQTLQLLQSKFPTVSFIPVAMEVVPVVDSSVSQSAAAATITTSLNQYLTNATTQE
eukprot:7777002-Ditylum_brightwellii.AAC.1